MEKGVPISPASSALGMVRLGGYVAGPFEPHLQSVMPEADSKYHWFLRLAARMRVLAITHVILRVAL